MFFRDGILEDWPRPRGHLEDKNFVIDDKICGLGLDDARPWLRLYWLRVDRGSAFGENGLSVIVCFAHESYKIRNQHLVSYKTGLANQVLKAYVIRFRPRRPLAYIVLGLDHVVLDVRSFAVRS